MRLLDSGGRLPYGTLLFQYGSLTSATYHARRLGCYFYRTRQTTMQHIDARNSQTRISFYKTSRAAHVRSRVISPGSQIFRPSAAKTITYSTLTATYFLFPSSARTDSTAHLRNADICDPSNARPALVSFALDSTISLQLPVTLHLLPNCSPSPSLLTDIHTKIQFRLPTNRSSAATFKVRLYYLS
ncbi:hypothetical protein F4604DRAFT_1730804 [Suillus subluteus]|nr:hypothetical protein F4604DRAFT_1730804 [Suillus subluteus]